MKYDYKQSQAFFYIYIYIFFFFSFYIQARTQVRFRRSLRVPIFKSSSFILRFWTEFQNYWTDSYLLVYITFCAMRNIVTLRSISFFILMQHVSRIVRNFSLSVYDNETPTIVDDYVVADYEYSVVV